MTTGATAVTRPPALKSVPITHFFQRGKSLKTSFYLKLKLKSDPIFIAIISFNETIIQDFFVKLKHFRKIVSNIDD